MKYSNTVSARFLQRPNRFVALADVNGKTETVHVKNTGRCAELLLPGAEIMLQRQENGKRKTEYDLISVLRPDVGWVNIDSQVPNALVAEWLAQKPAMFRDVQSVHPEYTFGSSRVDFMLEYSGRQILMEVKGCTLAIDGNGYFPDAPTIRGVKHLRELTRACDNGIESYLAFVIAMPGITTVYPHAANDPAFSVALQTAREHGVKVLKLPCRVEPSEIEIIGCTAE